MRENGVVYSRTFKTKSNTSSHDLGFHSKTKALDCHKSNHNKKAHFRWTYIMFIGYFHWMAIMQMDWERRLCKRSLVQIGSHSLLLAGLAQHYLIICLPLWVWPIVEPVTFLFHLAYPDNSHANVTPRINSFYTAVSHDNSVGGCVSFVCPLCGSGSILGRGRVFQGIISGWSHLVPCAQAWEEQRLGP